MRGPYYNENELHNLVLHKKRQQPTSQNTGKSQLEEEEEEGEKKENSQTHAFSSSPNPKKFFQSSAGLTMDRVDFIFILFFGSITC
jgi:hypothetical protein